MRILWVVAILLAGCSSPDAGEERVNGPIYEGGPPTDENGAPIQIEQVPMDPVEGTLTGGGTYDKMCGTISGSGSLLPSGSSWGFKVGTNATVMTIQADWEPPNPTADTIWIDILHQGELFATVSGAPGFSQDVPTAGIALDDRSVVMEIAPPECGGAPIAVAHYDGLEVDLSIEFA